MVNLYDEIRQAISGENVKIVLPEGTDERVLQAALKLHNEGLVTPIIVGPLELVIVAANQVGIDLQGIEIVDPVKFRKMDEIINRYVELRKGKTSPVQARIQLKDVNTLGMMLVFTGYAQGLISGAFHKTEEIVHLALQIIQTKPGVANISGAFIMVRENQRYIFADCAITLAPTTEELANIAVESAKTAKTFGIEPIVAMLSFSTKGSSVSIETKKVVEATKLAQVKAPTVTIDGELQFDAAFVPEVAVKIAKGSSVQGNANVFIFPSLEAANIGYKIAESLGGFESIGLILQGLNMPVNTLSSGYTADDIYNLALITAAQSVMSGE